MKKYFITAAKTTLVLVYAVIIAGALVRMTGSGMGCPDWPKCFGYYVPPTDIEELTWRPGREFERGQVIIKDEGLWVANGDFTTGQTFVASQWRPYTKHDYAIFNPTHTWIEYLNRLAGALAGMATFAMAICSFGYWREKKALTLLSWLTVFLMGFQAWLGATVVYSVLNPVKITLHMVVALLIVALVLYIIRSAVGATRIRKVDQIFKIGLIASLLLSLFQIILGTQVRQFVDAQVKTLGYDQMGSVLESPELSFYLHRSLSVVVVLLNLFLFVRNSKLELGYKKMNWVMLFLMFEILSGILMYYFAFPFGSQTIHLVMASLIFGTQFYLLLETKKILKNHYK
ncbi:MAG TPA: COX15/CtaA family protein [Flavobacterium sp.]|jgi:cytochrome c oxidase assembly protein subunit 15